MNKVIAVIVLSFFVCSCESNHEKLDRLKKEISEKEQRLSSLQCQLDSVNHSVNCKNDDLYAVNEKISNKEKILGILDSGRRPQYVIRLKMYQSHFSLSLDTHIKDKMNSIEMELPVSEEYFNSVTVGEKICERFRVGSFFMNGSFGDWNVKVISKEIK